MTREEELLRASRIGRLLQDEDFMSALDSIEADISDHMKATAWDEARLRECLHAEYRAMQRIRFKLQDWADELHK